MSLTVIVGPTAVGKTVVHQQILQKEDVSVFQTYTTRKQRDEEKKKDFIPQYKFLTEAEFEKKIKEGFFYEWVEYGGNYYGTSKKDVSNALASNQKFVGIVDIRGALTMLKDFPKVLTVFILPNSIEELEKRIKTRNTETEEEIKQRLKVVTTRELPQANLLDFQVVNNKIETTVKDIYQIILIYNTILNKKLLQNSF